MYLLCILKERIIGGGRAENTNLFTPIGQRVNHYPNRAKTANYIYHRLFLEVLKWIYRDKKRQTSVKIQPSVLVHLGFGKYVRSYNVVALIPL